MQEEASTRIEDLITVVENQITDQEPKKVAETVMRLRMTGYSREEAIEYIACALMVEIYDVSQNNGQFTLSRYEANLDTLPDMPWADEMNLDLGE
ncbi:MULTISPECIES: hypothetical protein [Salinivibrio]|jgi:hypothetical protein|uniref:hypothetical protein n=1 Tax=Salinivibrio TaxID=51366 RepID=UPI000985B48D|nr:MULTISPECIES: hypothetical protein [unclassified Salinivibrio]OOE92761.1 hypothetical protein BZG75_08505 [Salinivibrio sp. AR640]OOE99426.1 hypothetical protein BZG77_03410 [Salinivibrio sp. IB643]